MRKQNIRAVSKEDIESFFVSISEKPFRARQVYEWLWKKSARSFDEMTNLSKEVRGKLVEKYDFTPIIIEKEQRSHDRTIK